MFFATKAFLVIFTKTFQLKLVEQKLRDDNQRLNSAISELMDEAASKTRKEVEALKKLYNSHLEKLIGDCNTLELVTFESLFALSRS